MKVKRIVLIGLMSFAIGLAVKNSYAAVNTSVTNAPIPLSLEQAIQRLMDSNLSIKIAAITFENAQISYDIAWNSFFLPSISLTSMSSFDYSLGTFPNTPARLNSGFLNRGYPSSTINLTLGSYSLFNFFKDRANYDLAKLNYELAKLDYQQAIRSTKNQLISQYFQAKIAQEKLDAVQRSVLTSQAVLELIDSKKALGKATEDDHSSASVDLLNAKIEYSAQLKTVQQTIVQLNTTLNAPPETAFKLTTNPPFQPVKLNEKVLFDIFKTQSPTAKSLEISVASSEISASTAEKSRLPLPSLNFSGIVLSYNQSFVGNPPSQYNGSNLGRMDVSASISLSIPIFGSSGFLNEKNIRSAYINLERSELNYRSQMMNSERGIITSIAIINQLQDQILSLKESYEKNSKVLDSYFKKATSSSIDRINLRDALTQARNSELSYLDGLQKLIDEKNNLANNLGVDDLPGEKK